MKKQLLLLSLIFYCFNQPVFTQTIPDEYKGLDSRELNSLGFDYYNNMNYFEAARLFQYAAVLDPTWEIPPFNRACSNALLHKDNRFSNINDIISDLYRSYTLNSDRLYKIRTDSDLNSIRRTDDFLALTKALSDPDKTIIFENFNSGIFKYYKNYMYNSNADILEKIERDGRQWFIPLHNIQGLNLDNNLRVIVMSIYLPAENREEVFSEMIEGENPQMFGDVSAVESKSLYLLYYNRESMEIIGTSEIENQRAFYNINVSDLKSLNIFSSTLTFTTWDFAGGSYTNFWIAHITPWGQVVVSDPLIWSSEDLSGGEAPLSEYKNLRFENAFIVVDLFVDSQLKKTVKLLSLEY